MSEMDQSIKLKLLCYFIKSFLFLVKRNVIISRLSSVQKGI